MRGLYRWCKQRYAARMGLARQPEREFDFEHRADNLDTFENCWVATKDGEIIAAAESSTALAYKIREMGPRARGCVMQYVRPSTDAYIVGVG